MQNLKKVVPIQIRYYLNSWKSCFNLSSIGFILDRTLSEEVLLDAKVLTPLVERPNYYYINPVLVFEKNVLYVYFRETNVSIRPLANCKGQMKKIQTGGGLKSAVIRGKLSKEFLLLDQETYIQSTDSFPLEDVRAIYDSGNLLLIGTHVTTGSLGESEVLRTRICIRDTSGTRLLESPVSKNYEKNWVPIRVTGNSLELLHSTKPSRIVNFDLNSGTQTNYISEDSELSIELSGGTPFVRLRNGNYIRVARKRYPLFKKGYVHINFLVLHSAELKIIQVSKPFILNQLGFEICNGLAVTEDENLIFSWGENDHKMFVASSSAQSLLDWIQENPIQESRIHSVVSTIASGIRLAFRVRKL